jgi:hypothetical protein
LTTTLFVVWLREKAVSLYPSVRERKYPSKEDAYPGIAYLKKYVWIIVI